MKFSGCLNFLVKSKNLVMNKFSAKFIRQDPIRCCAHCSEPNYATFYFFANSDYL